METIFLKLGGSLITDKHKPYTANLDLLFDLANEIRTSYQNGEKYRLIIGHGSGSFGHQAAKQFGTRQGVQTRADWMGFLEVWKQARALNQIVIDALSEAGLPVLSFPPVSAVFSSKREILSWDTKLLQFALQQQLIPVIYGDVIFDQQLNGTILSTEELFEGIAKTIQPDRILIAGLEKGVWKDFPACTELFRELAPADMHNPSKFISGSNAVDVTGGMAEKVNLMFQLLQNNPGTEILIFSAQEAADIRKVLDGEHIGTLIHQG